MYISKKCTSHIITSKIRDYTHLTTGTTLHGQTTCNKLRENLAYSLVVSQLVQELLDVSDLASDEMPLTVNILTILYTLWLYNGKLTGL